MRDRMTTANATGAGFNRLSDAIVSKVYSKEILFSAMPLLLFDTFATVKTDLSANPGQTIQFLKYSNITKGGKLSEGVRIETKGLSTSTVDISVYEFGNGIKLSEVLLNVAFTDTMADGVKLLGRDYALTLNTYLRDIVLQGTNVVYGATTATGSTAATARSAVAGPFTTAVIKDAVQVLAQNNSPKINGDAFICFAAPAQLRKLRDDTNWLNSRYYASPQDILKGEVGRYEDVRFIETTIMPQGALTGDTLSYDATLDAAGASSADIYKAVMFGENAYGLAYALPVELRDNGIEDFGREHGVAWYSIMGADIIENNNIIVIETA